eukprot:scaffold321679_cov13-Prasinocladus_malaysianus.AAC.1
MCVRYAHRFEGCWPPRIGRVGGLTICPGLVATTCPDTTCLRQAAYLMLAAAASDTPPQTVT